MTSPRKPDSLILLSSCNQCGAPAAGIRVTADRRGRTIRQPRCLACLNRTSGGRFSNPKFRKDPQ